MAIPVDYFQPMTFQQANPLLSGIQAGQQIFGQGVQNAYLPSALSQQLQQMRLANAAQQIRNQYLAPALQASIGLTQAQTGAQQALPGLYGAEAQEALARGGMFGAQGNLIRQETPYEVQQAQVASYPDPLLSRGVQLQNAQRSGAIAQDYLNRLGLGNSTNTNGTVPLGINNQQNAAQQLPNQNGINTFNDPATNWALFGSPISPLAMMQLQAYGKGLDTQATTNVDQWNQAQQSATTAASSANDLNKYIDQFNDAYNRSTYVGPRLGLTHTKGLFAPPGNLTPEIAADNASMNMQAAAAKALQSVKLTNQELQFAGNLKVNRAMTPQAVHEISDFLKAKGNRAIEQQQFLNAARSQGVDPQTANTLWTQYNNQRPVYDFANKKPFTQFQKTWKDYLTPQAINAAKSGINYVPIPNFNSKAEALAWKATLNPPDIQTVNQQLMQGGQ